MAASSTTQEVLHHTDPPASQIQQVDIFMGLQENIQTPPPGEFRMQDLVWPDHVTTGKCRQKGSKMTFILWDMLEDFILGEQNNTFYPCKFNAEVIRRNLPNSLRSPRAYSSALVWRSDLLHFPLPLSHILMGFSNGALSNNSTSYARCSTLSVQCPSYIYECPSTLLKVYSYLLCCVVWHADIDVNLAWKTSLMLSQRTCKPSWNPLREKMLKRTMPNRKNGRRSYLSMTHSL